METLFIVGYLSMGLQANFCTQSVFFKWFLLFGNLLFEGNCFILWLARSILFGTLRSILSVWRRWGEMASCGHIKCMWVHVIVHSSWGEIVWLIRPILKCHGCFKRKLNLTCKGQLWLGQLIIKVIFALMISLITTSSLGKAVYAIGGWSHSFLCRLPEGFSHKQGVEISINLFHIFLSAPFHLPYLKFAMNRSPFWL